jgi:FkbM family methyltransferase
MSGILVTTIKLRSPFSLKRLPMVARLHRAASKQRQSRKGQLLITAPLEKLFRWYYRWVQLPASGEFELETAAGRRTIQFNGRNLAFDIFYADLFAENYEDETAVLLDMFVPSGGCFYDIGSNWGYFTLYVASRQADIRIHAFEPIPSTYADLTRCVDQAALGSRIECHRMAISDANGHVMFELPFHSASAQVGNTGRQVKVDTRTLDSMGLERPDFVKIDAEGHEAAVLRGSLKTLRDSKPFVMFENKLYRHAPQETLGPLLLLKQLGYELFVPAVQRESGEMSYFLNCGYQIDTSRMQKIQRQDRMALVPCEPAVRFLLPPYLNIFACHRDRLAEVRTRFQTSEVNDGP